MLKQTNSRSYIFHLLLAILPLTVSAQINARNTLDKINVQNALASLSTEGDLFVTNRETLAHPIEKELKLDVLPDFPGGDDEFANYVGSRMIYPDWARENNISGQVLVGFIVEKNGSLSGIKVLKGIGYGCDREAIRVLKSSPKWTPGLQNGKPVRVSFVIPLTFKLAK
ncbi:MAG: energy transducer TonB [Sphingobacteriaceae bacterium]|jgi:TonB family protein